MGRWEDGEGARRKGLGVTSLDQRSANYGPNWAHCMLFTSQVLLRHSHTHLYIGSVAAFVLQWHRGVVFPYGNSLEIVQPAKPEVFTI